MPVRLFYLIALAAALGCATTGSSAGGMGSGNVITEQEQARQIAINTVAQIRFYTASESAVRFGMDNANGVI